MTDWVGHVPNNHMTSLEGVEGDSATRFRALLRRHSIAVPQNVLIWLHPHFMVRADDHESVLLPHPFCAILAHLCQFHGWQAVTVELSSTNEMLSCRQRAASARCEATAPSSDVLVGIRSNTTEILATFPPEKDHGGTL